MIDLRVWWQTLGLYVFAATFVVGLAAAAEAGRVAAVRAHGRARERREARRVAESRRVGARLVEAMDEGVYRAELRRRHG